MTIDDLRQLRPLEGLIRRELERLNNLRASAGIHGMNLDGMPRAPGAKDTIGNLIPEIIDQESEIADNVRLYWQKKREIEQFINHLPDLRLRLICHLRFADGLPWEEVADQIGGRETGYSAKQAVYRYFQRLEGNNGKSSTKTKNSQD